MKKILLSSLLLFSANFIFAQFPNVLISTLNQPEEVSIAINPKNTNQIVAGSNLKNAYRSNNAGATWTTQLLACNAYDVYGDPVMIWDTANACYYIHLSNPNSAITPGGTWVDRIVVQKSGDFGQTYTTCVGVGKNGAKVQDKAWAVVNPYNNEMHMTWTQFDNYGSSAPLDSSIILYSKSTDGGNTFSIPKRISKFAGNCIDADSTVEGAVPAIGPLGEIYVGWAGQYGLMFQKSTDGGTTWLPTEQLVNAFIGGWDYTISGLYRCNGLPFTFCDLSNSPYQGTIYMNWSDKANGVNDGDVWITKSTNGGTTWSAPFRVNDDVPGKQQFMSAMTIDQVTGYVYVLFYDRRNYASGNNTDVYMAVSTNGGASFTNYKVNANPFSPNAGYFFGDYIGISAHNNVVRPIWMQMTNSGALSVYTALVSPATLGIENKKEENLGSITASPNPFKTETSLEFTLTKDAKLTIQLVDNVGRIIKELATTKNYFAGKNKIVINAQENNLKPGIYYVAFYGDEKSKFTKIVME